MLKFWKQLILTLTLVNKCIVAFTKISYECNKMHQNKLPGTLIFKIFWGSTRFPCAGGGALLQHIIPQDRRYRDKIVLRLLYNFLLLHFFNLKTLSIKDWNTWICLAKNLCRSTHKMQITVCISYPLMTKRESESIMCVHVSTKNGS